MEIKLSPKIEQEILVPIREYGYQGKKDFIEDAVRRRILELREIEFLSKTKGIQDRMTKKGITEKEILEDFEKF